MTPEMTAWGQRYRITGAGTWQGRRDGRLHERVHVVDLSQGMPFPPKGTLAVALIGFACDEGVRRNRGRVGAVAGPEALRLALGKLAMHSDIVIYDVGDVTCTDGWLEDSQAALATVVSKMVHHGIMPIVLGGGHELAWGHYQGLALSQSVNKLAIINIDAHYDLRPLDDGRGSSGTSFLQIATERQCLNQPFSYTCVGLQRFGNTQSLVNRAKELGVTSVYADQMESAITNVDEVINAHECIYLTICLDAFAAAYSPGVSAPQSLGLIPQQVLPIVAQIAASGKLIGMDIAELNPLYDRDGMTANLAATLIATTLVHLC